MAVDSLIENIVPSECNNNVVVFVNSIWANGKMGSITDSKGNGIFRFFEMKPGKFNAEVISEKAEDNPIVATGIVAYCLHNRKSNNMLFKRLRLSSFKHQSIKKQFDEYTADLFESYRDDREQEPESWRCNIEKEFYTNYVIPYVTMKNDESKALFEYITSEDCLFIQKLMDEYVLYLETKKEEFSDDRRKTESRKADKKPIIRQRMTWNVKEIRHSFCYTTRSMPAEEKNKRLSYFFNALNNRYISHTDMKTFIDIFSGVETQKYIVWRGFIVELQYFIETLIAKRLITWSRPAPGKWQIVCARFRIEHYVKEDDFEASNGQQSIVIDSLEPSQFNKIPKANKLSQNEMLDKIISILKEESDAKIIYWEIKEMFAEMETSEKETSKSQSQIKPIDY